jgi:hypothetical protein
LLGVPEGEGVDEGVFDLVDEGVLLGVSDGVLDGVSDGVELSVLLTVAD